MKKKSSSVICVLLMAGMLLSRTYMYASADSNEIKIPAILTEEGRNAYLSGEIIEPYFSFNEEQNYGAEHYINPLNNGEEKYVTDVLPVERIRIIPDIETFEQMCCNTVDEAALKLRKAAEDRQETATIYLQYEMESTADWKETASEYCHKLWKAATAHDPSDPSGGDYIRYQYDEWNCTYQGYVRDSEAGKKCITNFSYTFDWYTNSDEEAALNYLVIDILDQLNLDAKTEGQKILTIHNYLCDRISDNTENLNNSTNRMERTGYSALAYGMADSHGYAEAFYRLCLEAGIDARIDSYINGYYAWNMVTCEGKTYIVDVARNDKENIRENIMTVFE